MRATQWTKEGPADTGNSWAGPQGISLRKEAILQASLSPWVSFTVVARSLLQIIPMSYFIYKMFWKRQNRGDGK